MHRLLLLLLAPTSLLVAPSSLLMATPPAPGAPSYEVSLTGTPDGRTWSGRETVSFTNTAAEALPEVYVRLWGNSRGCGSVEVLGGTALRDCTVVKFSLPKALKPGERTSISFDVKLTAPDREDRFGRSGEFSFFGNALPVLAVRDATGWHLERDMGIGESFYTVAADFAVRLTHTGNIAVPSTGVTTDGVAIAKQVRDFAWAAGPFRSTSVTSPGGVTVRTWATPMVTAAAVDAARADAAAALDEFGRRFGAYPDHELDLVLNDRWTKFSGMEYPGFVLLISPNSPVVHEVAHQWWYGIVGNNEYADPWLDESFATYATDVFEDNHRVGCWPGTLPVAITRDMGYWGAHDSSYGTFVYTYGSCMLHELERLIGTPVMDRLLASYAKANWHGVVTPADFKTAAQAASSVDLAPFWRTHGIG
ncbi:M1 family metallopeptidase [Kribbella yunnanensis]|uniref:M1 family metallopeptidase n=1 Tax=Kribbella yunnanensis TaxID=190194 RepID=A0ABN2I3E2_9ACTN